MEKITSRKNEHIVRFKKIGDDKKYREQSGTFLCDGEKLFQEAIQWGADIKAVMSSDENLLTTIDIADKYYVTSEIMEYVSPLKSVRNIIFLCGIPSSKTIPTIKQTAILLENLQDPGNVGTVIRTAGAFNTDVVFLLGDCADIYNPKTIRATMGAIFRQKIIPISLDELKQIKSDGIKIYGAALSSTSVDIHNVQLDGSVVCIGSEGKGLSNTLLELCDKHIIIPMNEKCESLNAAVAAAVIMWEAYRR